MASRQLDLKMDALGLSTIEGSCPRLELWPIGLQVCSVYTACPINMGWDGRSSLARLVLTLVGAMRLSNVPWGPWHALARVWQSAQGT